MLQQQHVFSQSLMVSSVSNARNYSRISTSPGVVFCTPPDEVVWSAFSCKKRRYMFECDYCTKQFVLQSACQKHITMHKENPSQSFNRWSKMSKMTIFQRKSYVFSIFLGTLFRRKVVETHGSQMAF